MCDYLKLVVDNGPYVPKERHISGNVEFLLPETEPIDLSAEALSKLNSDQGENSDGKME